MILIMGLLIQILSEFLNCFRLVYILLSSVEDNPKPAKRKIVNYSDDEDSPKPSEPAKRPRLFSDDEDSGGDDEDISLADRSLKIQIPKTNLLDLDDDFITTEDPSDAPAAVEMNIERPDSRKWINSDEEKEKEEDNEKSVEFNYCLVN